MSLLKLLQNTFSRKPRFFAVTEYWIYVEDPEPVNLSAVMAKLMRTGEILPQEAMLASDIRLFCSTLRRAQNPHIFRPDLFSEHIEPSQAILEGFSRSETIVKIRFLSEEPLGSDAHLGLMPRLAADIARSKKGTAIFDSISEELLTLDQLNERNADVEGRYESSKHLRLVWMRSDNGGRAATRGLMKIGLPELQTPETRSDHRAIVCEVLERAGESIWEQRAIPETVDVSCYEDRFMVKIKPSFRGPCQARVVRLTEE